MKRFVVKIASSVEQAIAAHVQYIVDESRSPAGAEHWLRLVLESVDQLEVYPHRGQIAEESSFVPFDVRQRQVGSHLLLYTVDEEDAIVHIVSLRHAHQLPRPDDMRRVNPDSN